MAEAENGSPSLYPHVTQEGTIIFTRSFYLPPCFLHLLSSKPLTVNYHFPSFYRSPPLRYNYLGGRLFPPNIFGLTSYILIAIAAVPFG